MRGCFDNLLGPHSEPAVAVCTLNQVVPRQVRKSLRIFQRFCSQPVADL